MYRSILVPLDGSPFSEQALPVALGIARRAKAALQIVQVQPILASIYSEGPIFLESDLESQIKARQRAYLDNMARRLETLAPVRVAPFLLEGEIAPTLCSHVAHSEADLVVMTTHGRGPLARFWLGSVADEMLRKLSRPLLLLRPRDVLPDFSTEATFRRVLLPLDGTPRAEAIIEPALALGNLMGAEYTLLRAVQPVLVNNYTLEGIGIGAQADALIERSHQIQEQLEQEAQAYLTRTADRLRDHGLQVQTRVAIEDTPAAAILREVVSGAADVVALETHGRHGLSRLLLGSVADKVIRGSTAPVLVHRPPPS